MMDRKPKHRISNGYSRKKQIRQFDGYKVTSYTSTVSQNTPHFQSLEKQDENYLRLKRKLENMMVGNKTFKLYSRISAHLAQSVKDSETLKKVRQTECQLLKLILLNYLPQSDQIKGERKILLTHNVSKQNSLSSRPQTFEATTIKKRRLFPQSVGQSAYANFQKFKMNQSIKRLETQLQKIPQVGQLPSETINSLYTQVKKQYEISKLSEKRLSQQILVKDLRINNLIEQVSILQQCNSKLQQQWKFCQQRNIQLDQKLIYYNRNFQYEELWRMSNEEITTLKINKSELERELKHLNKKYKINKDRLNELIKNKSEGVMDEAKQDMEDVKFLIAELRHSFKNNEVKEEKKEQSKYKLPNILSLFDVERVNDRIKHTTHNKAIESEFFLKIRGIMDSKYNQFWSHSEMKNSMSLSDFAMGFLDKFTIDIKYKKIMINGSNLEQTEKNKLEFILNVSSFKLKDVIEIALFKQFLFDQRGRDQLFFFLSCRHVIFNGHVLDNFISSQDPILFVPLDRAFKIIDQILINFDKTLTDRIKQSLNLKRKKKNHKFFVDGHFLLKALLQLYSLERKKKQSIFQRSLVDESSTKKQILFKTFKKFINKNYHFVSNGEISYLYRRCWQVTEGQIPVESLFKMCDWIFVQELKDQIFLPKRFNNEYKQCIARVEQNFEEGKYFTRRILELGNQKLLFQSQKLKKLLVSLKSKDMLNMQHLFSLMNLLELPKTIKTIQILSISASYKLSKIPYLNESDFKVDQFLQLTEINYKNEEYRRKLREAAEKIGMYFDMRIKILYKRFGADINRQLADLSIGMS